MVKRLKNILSIVLVMAFLNVIIGKALHEFFEHHNEIHTCLNKDQTHFHEVELGDVDLICSFNFLVNFTEGHQVIIFKIVHFYEQQLKVNFLCWIKSVFHTAISLRGPPVVK